MVPTREASASLVSEFPPPWQRTQWAARIGCTSFVNVGAAGSDG